MLAVLRADDDDSCLQSHLRSLLLLVAQIRLRRITEAAAYPAGSRLCLVFTEKIFDRAKTAPLKTRSNRYGVGRHEPHNEAPLRLGEMHLAPRLEREIAGRCVGTRICPFGVIWVNDTESFSLF